MSDGDDFGPPPGDPRFDEEPASYSLANIDAEAAVLGNMMIENKIIEQVAAILKPEDFYEPAHQKLFKLIIFRAEEGKEANPVTLKLQVQRDPLFKPLGGAAYLATLSSGLAGLIGWRDFAVQVAELARMREISEAAEEAAQSFTEGNVTLSQATARLDDALARAVYLEKPVQVFTAADLMRKVRERSERLTMNALGSIGPTCRTISDLNTLFGPLDEGTYALIAGRPGMGKTSLAVSASWGYAANGHPGLYLAAEGNGETIGMRLQSDLSLALGMPIAHDSIRKDKLTPMERHDLPRIEEMAATLPIEYQEIERIDVRKVRSYVAQAAARWKRLGRKLEHVWVDYLQLLDASIQGRNIDDDRKRVNAISAALLGIAKDFGVRVFALSQLTRAVEARVDKRPTVSDLKESGRLEEDADIVLLLYREEHYLQEQKPTEGMKDFQALYEDWEIRMGKCANRLDLILGKNRHGERKTRTVKFFGKYYAVRGGDYAEQQGDPDENGWLL